MRLGYCNILQGALNHAHFKWPLLTGQQSQFSTGPESAPVGQRLKALVSSWQGELSRFLAPGSFRTHRVFKNFWSLSEKNDMGAGSLPK